MIISHIFLIYLGWFDNSNGTIDFVHEINSAGGRHFNKTATKKFDKNLG